MKSRFYHHRFDFGPHPSTLPQLLSSSCARPPRRRPPPMLPELTARRPLTLHGAVVLSPHGRAPPPRPIARVLRRDHADLSAATPPIPPDHRATRIWWPARSPPDHRGPPRPHGRPARPRARPLPAPCSCSLLPAPCSRMTKASPGGPGQSTDRRRPPARPSAPASSDARVIGGEGGHCDASSSSEEEGPRPSSSSAAELAACASSSSPDSPVTKNEKRNEKRRHFFNFRTHTRGAYGVVPVAHVTRGARKAPAPRLTKYTRGAHGCLRHS